MINSFPRNKQWIGKVVGLCSSAICENSPGVKKTNKLKKLREAAGLEEDEQAEEDGDGMPDDSLEDDEDGSDEHSHSPAGGAHRGAVV